MAHAGQLSFCLLLLLCCALLCNVSGHDQSAFTETDLQLQAAAPSTDVFAKGIKTVMESLVSEFKEKAPKAVQKALCDHIKRNIQKLVSQHKLRAIGDSVYRKVSSRTVSVADIFISANNQLLKKIPVLEVTVKCTPLYIEVKSRPFGGSFTIIPNLLKVSQLSVIMVLPQTLKPSILFSGTVTIARQPINVQITYTFSKDGEFEVSADTRLPSLKLKEVVQRLTSLSIPLPSSVGFLDNAVLKMKGTFTKSLDGDMVIEVQLKSGNRIFAILQRENGKTKTAIAADIAKIRLSHLIRSLTRQDISSVPFLGTLMLPELGVTVSKKTIVSELASEQFKNTRLLKYFAENIPSGLTAFIRIHSMKVIMKVTYNSEQMSLKVKEGALTVRNVLKQIRVNVGRIPLPAGFAHIWDIQVAEIGYNFKDRFIFITFELKKTLSYFRGLIQVMNPTVRLEIKQPKIEVTMEANGYVTIAGTKFLVLITKGDDGKYYLDAFAKKISFGSVLKSFKTSFLPPQLSSLASSLPFLNFGVKDFRIVLPFDRQRRRVYLSGKPVIAGYSLVKISAVMIRQKKNIITILEIDLGHPNLAHVLGQIAPGAAGILKHIAILNQNIPIRIIISPRGVIGVKLSKEIAQTFNIHRGITLRADLKMPSSCGKDKFCKVVQHLIPGNTRLSMEASIVSTTYFRVQAVISGDIKIPGGLITMKQAGLEVKVAGGVTSIGIIGKVALHNPKLDLTARIYQSVTSVILEMIAAGCWNNAFGIPILDICDVQGSVGIGPETGISEIAFGAKIKFGPKKCRPLTAIGYMGINSNNPNQNYYYAKLPGRSLSVLLRAMCIKTRIIPAPIAKSGLMPGFLFSFSVVGKSIPEIRLHIPAGLQLNGRMNILGYIVSANIKVNPLRGIYVAISMPPLNIAKGLLKIYRSPSDRSHGPFLKADLRPPTIKVQACGYISVLGISVSSCLKITIKELMFTIHGRILHIMRASLTIYTQNGGSLITRNFQAKGTINPGEFHRLVNPVRNAVSHLANVAGNAVRKASNFLSNRLNGFNIANSALNRARNVLGGVQGRFNGAANRVKSLRHRVNSICHIRRCGSKCIVPRCGCHRRGWSVRCSCSGCRHSITDPICYAQNKACQRLKAAATGALNVASHFLNGVSRALGGARRIFHHATNLVNAARRAWNYARRQLNNVIKRFQNGVQMLSQIKLRGLNNVFAIEHISIEAPLTNAALGKYHASLRVKIQGRRRHFSFGINLRKIVQSIIRPLAAQLGVGGLIGRK